ncbi:MAG: protein kinase domain-containing protein, partial [Planctomycetota bacterium]
MVTGKPGIHDSSGGPELPSNLRQDLDRALNSDEQGRRRACEALSQLYPEYAPEIRSALGLQPGSLDPAESDVRILEPLGQGSMGEIYLAERTLDSDESELRRFRLGLDRGRILVLREGKPGSLEALGDPILAADTSLEQRPGYPRFILEELEAQPITEFCDRQRLSVPARIELLLQACAGIQSAHQRGLCHLDLKPSNIVVDARVPPDRVRVLHFGLAGHSEGIESSLGLLGDRYL